VSVIAKVAYSYDTNGWFFMEGKFFYFNSRTGN
jgi:hypothetical protein